MSLVTSPRAQQTTILIVEDEPITREILVRYLERAGIMTRSCSTGEEALGIFHSGAESDWLLTDINLPGCIDGWVVGAEFHSRYPLRPVIYASACAPTLKSDVAGGVYIPKPFSPAQIFELIQQLSGRKRLETAERQHTGSRTCCESAPRELRSRSRPRFTAQNW